MWFQPELFVFAVIFLLCLGTPGQAQNGTWSSWREWQSCDRECEGGVQVRSRDCLGRGNCIGNATVTQTCNDHTCPFDGYIVVIIVASVVCGVILLVTITVIIVCKRNKSQEKSDDESINLVKKKRKVVIDADAGVDDAQAILMALAYPNELDVVAITTVHGNSSCKNVTCNVLRLLQVAKRLDIPVYQGAAKPHTGKPIPASYYHGKDGFGDVPDPKAPGIDKAQSKSALDALQQLARDHNGNLELICIGPLTNIAQVIDKDPNFGDKIKHCYIMGGNFKGEGNITKHAEFNFYADPESANIVLTKLGCQITMACWELVKSCSFSWDWYHKSYINAPTEKARFIKKIEKNTVEKFYKDPKYKKKEYETPDQMAVALALNPDMKKSTGRASASVDCTKTDTRGKMQVSWGAGNITIVKMIDRKLYTGMLESYMKC